MSPLCFKVGGVSCVRPVPWSAPSVSFVESDPSQVFPTQVYSNPTVKRRAMKVVVKSKVTQLFAHRSGRGAAHFHPISKARTTLSFHPSSTQRHQPRNSRYRRPHPDQRPAPFAVGIRRLRYYRCGRPRLGGGSSSGCMSYPPRIIHVLCCCAQ